MSQNQRKAPQHLFCLALEALQFSPIPLAVKIRGCPNLLFGHPLRFF
jgi:hypothetical protein